MAVRRNPCAEIFFVTKKGAGGSKLWQVQRHKLYNRPYIKKMGIKMDKYAFRCSTPWGAFAVMDFSRHITTAEILNVTNCRICLFHNWFLIKKICSIEWSACLIPLSHRSDHCEYTSKLNPLYWILISNKNKGATLKHVQFDKWRNIRGVQ